MKRDSLILNGFNQIKSTTSFNNQLKENNLTEEINIHISSPSSSQIVEAEKIVLENQEGEMESNQVFDKKTSNISQKPNKKRTNNQKKNPKNKKKK